MPAKRAAVLTWACLLVTSVLGQDAGRAPPCSRTCRADNCDSLNIKYGKYCGIGYTGCSEEKPCDGVDSCCKKHDGCCTRHGLMYIPCHERFIKCLNKEVASGRMGFSDQCPYSKVVPLMEQSMQVAMMFGTHDSAEARGAQRSGDL
ncbi:hypothetical protein WJX72_012513 [[Myrmecia] bisecta]|uniref:Phospholipase A2 n=1 Tax=[Myrmecia] bisecta TaxID=41462 RepID=A0AAW1PIL5_9CHLO